jgi:hypothetical protein
MQLLEVLALVSTPGTAKAKPARVLELRGEQALGSEIATALNFGRHPVFRYFRQAQKL